MNTTWVQPQSNINTPLNSECCCPVCRHHEIPKLLKNSACMSGACTSTNLWLCLTCGHIGCSRDMHGHASKHYNATGHPHVMHINAFSIWDYDQNKYVHRIFHGSGKETKCKIGTENETDFEERMQHLENEWKSFCQLKETNQKMMSIEQRLKTLSENKKLLEEKLREHDAKLNELLNQLKRDVVEGDVVAQSSLSVGNHRPADNADHEDKKRATSTLSERSSVSIFTLKMSETLDQSQASIVEGTCKHN